ncbi:MAG: DUF1365 family protein [Gemmatimonadales bacterium]|nr:DUF1365 family protein [Gemmatimonadales bacterium]NIN12961.1 DUF1365 family protein [Gemmatimonadales bacterium]NIR02636.1 DUF1365 family protein [Gemmatimonadales bacterium]NIS67212.1 DUF1365 family protein [Gemmatimonadales bacterium]
MNSCIYEGVVRHRRTRPVAHAFRYRLFMMYLDLDELPELFDGRWLWSARRFAPAWFRRGDYLGDPSVPLATAVRDLAERRTGRRPTGPIRLLTHLRYFGYVMNPVSFYYCFDQEGETVETILAEITNTPWNERHTYVLGPADNLENGRVKRRQIAKAFHVSPFMSMDQWYDWRFSTPGRRLVVHMQNFAEGRKLFDATLALRRRQITGRSLAATLARYPLMTARVVAAIYWQALRLWAKRAPFYVHPAKAAR